MSFGISAFLFSISVVDDVEGDMRAIDEMAHRSPKHVFERFSNLVQFISRKRFGINRSPHSMNEMCKFNFRLPNQVVRLHCGFVPDFFDYVILGLHCSNMPRTAHDPNFVSSGELYKLVRFKRLNIDFFVCFTVIQQTRDSTRWCCSNR